MIGDKNIIVKRQDSFSTYHPIVNLVYFIFTIGYALAFTHPVCLGMSFIGAFVYSVLLRGYKIYDPTYIADGAHQPGVQPSGSDDTHIFSVWKSVDIGVYNVWNHGCVYAGDSDMLVFVL